MFPAIRDGGYIVAESNGTLKAGEYVAIPTGNNKWQQYCSQPKYGVAMGILKLAVVLGTAFALAGCKTTVESEVKLSDLLSGPSKSIPSNLYVEVAGCSDHKDSRLPSSSLIEVRDLVPTIFAGSEFVECFRKDFDSLARFSLPVTLTKNSDGKPPSEEQINLISNEKALLAVSIPKTITEKINSARTRTSAPSLDMKISIKVINDTGKDFGFYAVASYVDELPAIFDPFTSKKDRSFTVRLSDVSVSTALKKGKAAVLAMPNP